jgi:hypothetical protein
MKDPTKAWRDVNVSYTCSYYVKKWAYLKCCVSTDRSARKIVIVAHLVSKLWHFISQHFMITKPSFLCYVISSVCFRAVTKFLFEIVNKF